MDDVEREGCGVGNGVDRERVDVVVDYVDKNVNARPWRPGTKDKKSTKPTARTLQQLHPERRSTTLMTMAITK